MIRVLLIGPLQPPMGGASRHFETLVDDLGANRDFETIVVNTSRGTRPLGVASNLAAGWRSIRALLGGIRRAQVVSFHASNRGMLLFGPLLVAVCRLARRPVILRVFGGSFGDYYAARGPLGRAVIRHGILSADVVLLQTHRAIAQLRDAARGSLVWFSTYIHPPADAGPPADMALRERCTRFVYLGHLWRAKGIEMLLDSATMLPGEATIDVYGPEDDYAGAEIDARGQGRVRYGGLLTNTEVDARLWHYDCLVLPTTHSSEGYPAVVAEAFAHGLPVIVTRWLAIPEIVDESCGILVEPGDTRAFVEAVSALYQDPALWRRLQSGARERAARFDHATWARVFEDACRRVLRH